MKVLKTEVFNKWLIRLKNKKAKAIIQVHINRLIENKSGVLRSIGESVYEKKIDYGPGYRLYLMNQSKAAIVLLCGGDKSTQQMDIEKAKAIAREIKKRRERMI